MSGPESYPQNIFKKCEETSAEEENKKASDPSSSQDYE